MRFDALDRLSERYQLGIVTSGSRVRVVRELERLNADRFFATIVAGDDVARPKPAPEPLELALRQLSIGADEAVYVGDAYADFEMSRAAGVRFVV